jgi:hypothetical protein
MLTRYECSKCRMFSTTAPFEKCPQCGAIMRNYPTEAWWHRLPMWIFCSLWFAAVAFVAMRFFYLWINRP